MPKKIKFKKIKVRQQTAKGLCVIVGVTFSIAMLFSYICETLINDVPLFAAFIILTAIILIGIFFDGIGNAVVSVDEVVFHSMAASKVKGAKECITLVRNAPIVANILNDVVGDIAGIISGSTATAIVLTLEKGFGRESMLLSIAMSGFVAALTVGGKALGKGFAIQRARYIVYYTGVVMYYIKRLFRKRK